MYEPRNSARSGRLYRCRYTMACEMKSARCPRFGDELFLGIIGLHQNENIQNQAYTFSSMRIAASVNEGASETVELPKTCFVILPRWTTAIVNLPRFLVS